MVPDGRIARYSLIDANNPGRGRNHEISAGHTVLYIYEKMHILLIPLDSRY
jgi:hypothetical protein